MNPGKSLFSSSVPVYKSVKMQSRPKTFGIIAPIKDATFLTSYRRPESQRDDTSGNLNKDQDMVKLGKNKEKSYFVKQKLSSQDPEPLQVSYKNVLQDFLLTRPSKFNKKPAF